jgi:hypothetical protein
VKSDRDLATWLLTRRNDIEAFMNARLGPATPLAASPEAEALRRFRSFAASSLKRGEAGGPALDDLRVNLRRTDALLDAWVDAAAGVCQGESEALRIALAPLVGRFRTHLRGASSDRRSPRICREAPIPFHRSTTDTSHQH